MTDRTILSAYNGDKYLTTDKVCADYINSGRAEPYSGNYQYVKNLISQTGRNAVYLDVGGNIGTHSVVFSRIFKSVITFEPDSLNYEVLLKNIEMNGCKNIQPHNKALASKSGLISTKSHSNHSRGCIYTVDGGNIESIPLDSLNLTNVDFIKIDVEGHELDVLKGSIDTIKRFKPFIELEYNGLSKKLFDVSYDDISKFLLDLNYIYFHRIDDNFFFRPNQ